MPPEHVGGQYSALSSRLQTRDEDGVALMCIRCLSAGSQAVPWSVSSGLSHISETPGAKAPVIQALLGSNHPGGQPLADASAWEGAKCGYWDRS